ncbi:MAG: alpha/beta hydrolase family protein [Dehalococcoidia bacterium]
MASGVHEAEETAVRREGARTAAPPVSARHGRWLVTALVVVPLSLWLALFSLSPATRAAVRTALFFPRLFNIAGPLTDLGSSQPVHETVELRPVYGYVHAHITRPPRGRHPAIVLCFGLAPGQIEGPSIQRLLDGIARGGFVAVLVESQVMDNAQLFPNLPQVVVEGFQFAEQQSYVRADRIGMIGISMGAPMVLAAAAQPEIRDRVRAIDASDGLYTLRDTILSVTTHTLDDDGAIRPWQPSHNAQLVIRDALASTLTDPKETTALKQAFFVRGPKPVDRADLSPGGQAIYDLLSAPDRATGERLLAKLPELAQQGFQTISPAQQLQDVRAPLFVMYDRGDDVLPFTGSRELCRRAKTLGIRTYCTPFSRFGHVVGRLHSGSPLDQFHDLAGLFLRIVAFQRAIE